MSIRPGPLGEPEAQDYVEVRVTGQPDPFLDSVTGEEIGQFPFYEHTFRTDRDTWQHCAGIAARALTEWTDGDVQMRRVRVETRTSEWSELSLTDFDDAREDQP